MAKRVGDLEVAQDLDFQRAAWRVQRVGWIVMGIVILLGLAGVFGEGLLSQARLAQGPIELQYARLARLMTPTQLEVQMGPGTSQFWLPQDFLSDYDITGVFPEPQSVTLTGDGALYAFEVQNPESPVTAILNIEPERLGVHRGAIGPDSGSTAGFWQFVYP